MVDSMIENRVLLMERMDCSDVNDVDVLARCELLVAAKGLPNSW